MSGEVAAALVGGLVGLLGGAVGPAVIARLPEPELAEAPEDGEQDEGSWRRIAPAYTKTAYADLATRPHLAAMLAVSGAVLGALLGARLGWSTDLLVVLPLVPPGVWLCYVDWRTTFLPTRIIAPMYVVVVVLVPVAALLDGDWTDARRALIGWALYGGWYLLNWLLTPGYGYGDVRLSGVLGIALGWLGWSELVLGLVGGVFLVGVGGLLLVLLRIVDRARNPAGPHLLIAAVVAAGFGPSIAHALGY